MLFKLERAKGDFHINTNQICAIFVRTYSAQIKEYQDKIDNLNEEIAFLKKQGVPKEKYQRVENYKKEIEELRQEQFRKGSDIDFATVYLSNTEYDFTIDREEFAELQKIMNKEK